MDKLEVDQVEARGLIRGIEGKTYEGLKEMNMYSLAKRQVRGNDTTDYRYL